MNTINQHILCEAYLQLVYQFAVISPSSKSISETYGEILPVSIDKLLSVISLTEHDVFYDLGSGLGKLALQVFMKSSVKTVCGIELNPDLHAQAFAVAERVRHDLPDFYAGNRRLAFVAGSFLDLPFTEATVVLVASPCFGPDIIHALEKKIAATPSIHSVLTLRPMHGLQRLRYQKTMRIECSWDSALCYLYSI